MLTSTVCPVPPVGNLEADDELCQRVRMLLGDTRRPGVSQLAVQVSNGVVTLQGQVATFFVRQLAIEGARRVAGVQMVIDQIVVVCQFSPRDASESSDEPW
jgi:osmotically-inducible protein OsmY